MPKLAAAAVFAVLLNVQLHGAPQPVIIDSGTTFVQELVRELKARHIEMSISRPTEAGQQLGQKRLWVVAHAGEIDAPLLTAITRHLSGGGRLLVLGEPPFQTVFHEHEGRRLRQDRYLEKTLKPTPLEFISFVRDGQTTISTDITNSTPTVDVISESTGDRAVDAIRMRVPRLHTYANYGTTVTTAIPREALTTFWARGSALTRQMAVEWQEKDGSRWIATVNLTPEWKFYALRPEEFLFWYDSNSKKRGGRGDVVCMDNVELLAFGLALTHTRIGEGPHEFAIAEPGYSAKPAGDLAETPVIECLSPKWMLYPMQPASAVVEPAYRAAASTIDAVPDSAWSSYWRPMGSGIDKKRRHRFIPVVTAMNSEGTRAGCLAAIMLHFSEPYRDAVYGYVSVEDDASLLQPSWLNIIARMIENMRDGAFLTEAGSSEFTYDVRDAGEAITIGAATFLNPRDMRVKLSVRDKEKLITTVAHDGPMTTSVVRATYLLDGAIRPLHLRAELSDSNGLLRDVIEQTIGFDGPRDRGRFVTAKDRLFWRNSKAFRLFGTNYMPSSGLARTVATEFEYWIEDPAYDPVIVGHDLGQIAGLGMNVISVFIYKDSAETGNLLDLLRLARQHHLLVNLSLRPNHAPFPADREVLHSLIKTFRTAEKDEVMAYDVAWEPWWGREDAREKFANDWQQWVKQRYGSIEAAQRQWSFAPADLAAFPEEQHLRQQGPWVRAVADYRRFVDETLEQAYSKARADIREIDSNHLVSFRQSEGANPNVDPEYFPIDLSSICRSVDFFSPEAYGIGERAEASRTMSFSTSYAQGLAPGKPVIWAEYGNTVWTGDAFVRQTQALQKQAQVYRNVLTNAEASRSAGTIHWWFPGGYRRGEESDYGIFHPDGTSRPGTRVLREHAARAVLPFEPVEWTPELKANRDKFARGFAGLFEELEEPFYEAITSQSIPLLVPEATAR